MSSLTEVPQWHIDLLDAARPILKPGWCCVVTLKADGECRAIWPRLYKRRQDAFACATRLLNDAELVHGSLTPNYYVVQATDTQLVLYAGPGYVMHIAALPGRDA